MLAVGVFLLFITMVSASWAVDRPSARWATILAVISLCAAIEVINTHIPH